MKLAWIVVCGAAACGGGSSDPCVTSDVSPAYVLTAPGISVEIATAPYTVTVKDATGRAVVTSAGAGAGGADGYGPTAWTTGAITTDNIGTSGYFLFQPSLDPWRGALEVTAAESTPTSVTLTLRDTMTEDAPCTVVTYTVRDSALRVEAHLAVDGTVAAPPRAWSASFTSPADEGFLGFGERFNRTNHRGKKVFSYLEEGGIGAGEGELADDANPFPNGEEMAYYPVPFFVSTAGYGFWLDTTWRSQFELATERADAWRVWHVGPTLAYEIYTPIPDDARPWPYHVIDRFTAATGRPMRAPAWVYGPRRRFGPGSMPNGTFEDQAMRDLDLAITAVDDANHFYPNGSHIGNEANNAAWTARARALGYRVNAYFNSMINTADDSPLAARADEGVANGYFLREPDGTFPNIGILTGGNFVMLYLVDFTSPAATEWYASTFDWATAVGYSGWMYDFGEYVATKVLAANGMTGDELHNLYPVLYAKAVHDHMEAGPHAGDWLAFMRSGYTGSSHYVPAIWAGDPAASFEDADGLPSMIRGGVNMGIAGGPNWGGDIGGYHCVADGAAAADGELLARWIQQGALSPIMQDQNACVGASAAQKASIWSSTDAQDAWRTYARLHTRLFPYLYTLGAEATRTGAPIMRHVFLEHPDRVDLAGEDTAYYLGPALYVAPVVARGAREKTVTLPDGTYMDWDDHAIVAGGRTVTLAAPLAKLPLLVREGHLVPLLDPTIDTLAEESSDAIVSLADVTDVYDVVGLMVTGTSEAAAFTLHDGGTLSATWTGGVAAPASIPEAANAGQLATCDACYLIEELAPGVTRVRISAGAGTATAGGLSLTSATDRRIRWDVTVVDD
jgi:alpha-glucosidase